MRAHVEALFTHDDAGDLVRVNEPNGAPAPRFLLGKSTQAVILRFRYDIDDELREELSAAARSEDARLDAPPNAVRYEAILARQEPVVRTWAGPAFTFPPEIAESEDATLVTEANAELLRPLLAGWIPDVELSQPMFALVVDGQAVSVCASVRLTVQAYEAGVDTARAYRGRGYAARVAAAWARGVRDLGRIPLYSTSWQNEASRAVARKLHLIQFGSDLHIT